jgi:hypothetical protein
MGNPEPEAGAIMSQILLAIALCFALTASQCIPAHPIPGGMATVNL